MRTRKITLCLMLLLFVSCSSVSSAHAFDWFGTKAKKETKEQSVPPRPTPVSEMPAFQMPEEKAPEAVVAAEAPVVEEEAPSQNKFHKKNMDLLKQRLANNNSLTAGQKRGLIVAMEEQFGPDADLGDSSYEKSMLVFEGVANDPNMTPEQKTAAIKERVSAQSAPAPEVQVQAEETQGAQPFAAFPAEKKEKKSKTKSNFSKY